MTTSSPTDGQVVEVRCHHVPDSIGTNPSGRQDRRGHPLGASGAVGAGRGPALRPAVPRPSTRRGVRRGRQSGFSGGDAGRPPRAQPGGRRSRKPLATGARRLFRVRCRGLAARCAGDQPDRHAPRLLAGQDGDRRRVSGPAAAPRAARTHTRPPKRSRIEYRAEGRSRDPLLADRFATWPATFGLGEHDVDLLTADRPTGDLFERSRIEWRPTSRGGPMGHQRTSP